MFYETDKNNHGLPRNPFKSCVVPRPIGWISTVSTDGVHNLAPYSQFQNLSFDPPYVMFAASQNIYGRRKDTVLNAEQIGEFVWNMATYNLREAVNITGQPVPPDVDEFELAGLIKAPSILVKPPRVAESPVHFECYYHQTMRLPCNRPKGMVDLVIGRVIGVHIDDKFITSDGKVDILRIRPIARLGYSDYTTVDSIFEMIIPGSDKNMRSAMEGNPLKSQEA
jgi:flavin reductase (DIM6/NTAB) family NADH-FMN oxidoreductase RutF